MKTASIAAAAIASASLSLWIYTQAPRWKYRGENTQRTLVRKFVYEGYVEWAIHNPRLQCPANLWVVAQEMGRNDTKDAWGRELLYYCGKNLPAEAKRDGFAVVSIGPDGIAHTADDIESWE